MVCVFNTTEVGQKTLTCSANMTRRLAGSDIEAHVIAWLSQLYDIEIGNNALLSFLASRKFAGPARNNSKHTTAFTGLKRFRVNKCSDSLSLYN